MNREQRLEQLVRELLPYAQSRVENLHPGEVFPGYLDFDEYDPPSKKEIAEATALWEKASEVIFRAYAEIGEKA